MEWSLHDEICNRWTGCAGTVVAAARTEGLFKGQLQVKYNNSGRTYFVSSDHLVDVSRSAEIIRANKKNKPVVSDDE